MYTNIYIYIYIFIYTCISLFFMWYDMICIVVVSAHLSQACRWPVHSYKHFLWPPWQSCQGIGLVVVRQDDRNCLQEWNLYGWDSSSICTGVGVVIREISVPHSLFFALSRVNFRCIVTIVPWGVTSLTLCCYSNMCVTSAYASGKATHDVSCT